MLNRRLHRLVWVYTCQNATLLKIACHGSNYLLVDNSEGLDQQGLSEQSLFSGRRRFFFFFVFFFFWGGGGGGGWGIQYDIYTLCGNIGSYMTHWQPDSSKLRLRSWLADKWLKQVLIQMTCWHRRRQQGKAISLLPNMQTLSIESLSFR